MTSPPSAGYMGGWVGGSEGGWVGEMNYKDEEMPREVDPVLAAKGLGEFGKVTVSQG